MCDSYIQSPHLSNHFVHFALNLIINNKYQLCKFLISWAHVTILFSCLSLHLLYLFLNVPNFWAWINLFRNHLLLCTLLLGAIEKFWWLPHKYWFSNYLIWSMNRTMNRYYEPIFKEPTFIYNMHKITDVLFKDRFKLLEFYLKLWSSVSMTFVSWSLIRYSQIY